MWFRNLTLYSFTSMPGLDALNVALARQRYAPCTDMQQESSGFVPHNGGDWFAFSVDPHVMISLCIEKKVLPAAVVRDELAERVAQVEREQGHKVGRKQKAELREDVTDALLAQAFSVRRTVRGWLDLRRNLLAIDTASQPTAELFVRHLIRAIETDIGLRNLSTAKTAVEAMTAWVSDEPPADFTIDDDTTFAGNNGCAVKYSKVSVEQADVARQIESGKLVTRLALTHAGRVSFVLAKGVVLRRIAPVGTLNDVAKTGDKLDPADFLLMAAALSDVTAALIDALGGIATPADLADEPGTGEAAPTDSDADPLTEQARQIVTANGRASISLVQRHLRIGYNRAAALLEALEHQGIVSCMDNSGTRRVLAREAK
jgi:recombination associated protein RdgC